MFTSQIYEPHHEKNMLFAYADQLRSKGTADQRLYFRYIDSTIHLLSKLEISASSHLQWLYSPACVGSGRKPQRQVFSQCSSYQLALVKHIISIFDENEWIILLFYP